MSSLEVDFEDDKKKKKSSNRECQGDFRVSKAMNAYPQQPNQNIASLTTSGQHSIPRIHKIIRPRYHLH